MQLLSLVGYHGTCCTNADSILESGFRISNSEGEWLGDGVYFFIKGLDNQPQLLAEKWATAEAWDNKEKRYLYDEFCVVKSDISVRETDLLDLTVADGVEILSYVTDKFKYKISKLKIKRKLQYIDALVLNMIREEGIFPFKVVKGNFYIKFAEERKMLLNSRINNCTICAVCTPEESIKNSVIFNKGEIK